MTKEEIIKELDYHGVYTKKVKAKLKKLLKEYHPDNNKEDKKTILLLYDIKKQLENGTLEHSPNSNTTKEKKSPPSGREKRYLYFLENMIEVLKKKKREIDKKISYLYKKLNKHTKDRNKKQDELGKAAFRVDELQKEINLLSKIDILDKLIIGLIIILWIFSIVFRKIFLLIISALLIILEIYYIYIRYLDYNEKVKRLEKSKKKLEKVSNEFNDIEKNVQKLKKEEVRLKKERSKINNDIQFYNHEISKIKEKNANKEKENNKVYGK